MNITRLLGECSYCMREVLIDPIELERTEESATGGALFIICCPICSQEQELWFS